jgi:hypothetical protein
LNSIMNNKELEKKVKQFTSELAYKKGYVCSVDVLIKLGYITERDYQDWRFGKISYLEKACQANLHKLSAVNRFIRKYSAEWNFEKSWTAYYKWGKGPKKRLIFSKSKDHQIETLYATHFLNKKRITELKTELSIKNTSIEEVKTKNQEINSLPDERVTATTT